jgi:glycosyltransferase involved in cell wall biosynthesis
MKTLFLHKEFNESGGIGALYGALKPYFTDETSHLEIGSRQREKYPSVIRFVNDNIRFYNMIKSRNFDCICINPCLDFKSLFRDFLFVLIGRPFCKRLVLFFHGWDRQFGNELSPLWISILRSIMNKTNLIIVLAKEFEHKLKRWDITCPIVLTRTAVSMDLLKTFDFENVIKIREKKIPFKILFLSRIVKEKGIYETIDAVRLLVKENLPIELEIAGDGPELSNVKKYVDAGDSRGIRFLGYIRGIEKTLAYTQSSLYIMPSYAEGYPLSVLEAFAFGLPVITRMTGGIRDFFINGVHGYATESFEPMIFADFIKQIFSDRQHWETISRNNFKFAKENYYAPTVALLLETQVMGKMLIKDGDIILETNGAI